MIPDNHLTGTYISRRPRFLNGLLFLFLLSLCGILPARAGNWFPVGEGLDTRPVLLVRATANKLFVAVDAVDTGSGTYARIKIWDGVFWDSLPMVFIGAGSVKDIAEYNGEIFIIGTWNPGIQKYGANGWQGVVTVSSFPALTLKFNALLVHDDKLYIGGYFGTVDGNVKGNSFMYYDQSGLHAVEDTSTHLFGTKGSVTGLGVIDGKVIVGRDSSNDGMGHLVSWNGKIFELFYAGKPVKQMWQSGHDSIVALHSDGQDSLFLHSVWERGIPMMNGIKQFFNYTNLAFYQGKPILSGSFKDKNDVIRQIISWDGIEWTQPVDTGLTGNASIILRVGNELYAQGSNPLNMNGQAFQRIARYAEGKTMIRARILLDSSGSCSARQGVLVKEGELAIDNAFWKYPDKDGVFRILIPSGLHAVQMNLPEHLSGQSCNPLKVWEREFLADSTTDIYYYATYKPGESGLRAAITNVSGALVRPGEVNHFSISGTPTYDIPEAASYGVKVIFPWAVDSFSSNIPFDSKTSNSVSWVFGSKPGVVSNIGLNARIPDIQTSGQTFEIVVQSGIMNGASMTIMHEARCRQNAGAAHPGPLGNWKFVFPAESDSTGFVYDNDEYIEFKVHFVNETNAIINTLKVIDTLDLGPKLANPAIYQGKSSHAYTPGRISTPPPAASNVLIFSFADLDLQPMNMSDASTTGYVSFKIKVGKDMPVGYVMHNRAVIEYSGKKYFTNTVQAVRKQGVGIREVNLVQESAVLLYPQPAQNQVQILSGKPLLGCRLWSVTGQLLKEVQLDEASTELNLGLDHFGAGVYVVEVWGKDGKVEKKSLIISK